MNKPPVPSGGKTLGVAPTRDNQRTQALINGQPILIGVHADIAKPTR